MSNEQTAAEGTIRVIGIDVGPTHSAYCRLNDGKIGRHEWIGNALMLKQLSDIDFIDGATVVLESPQAQNRPLGPLLRDTIWSAAQFALVVEQYEAELVEADERDVRCYIAGSRSASNADLLNSLKGIFGDRSEQPCHNCRAEGQVDGKRGPKKCPTCKGNKCVTIPGPLQKIGEHERSALAAAYWHWRRSQDRKATA